MDNKGIFETKEINNIIDYFDLGSIQEISPAKHGISNQNFFVVTTKGKYVVKILKNQTTESIKNGIYIQSQLETREIKSPKYISTNDKYIYENNKTRAVVSEKLEGETIKVINCNLATEFGSKLAGFHLAVTKLPNPNKSGLMNPIVANVQSDIFSINLPTGIIHGDFHLGNALAIEDEITAILDFEEAGENIYIIDLALTVMGVCSYSDDEMDIALIQNTLQGYEKIRSLNNIEKQYFNAAIRYSAETWIKWFIANGYERYANNHKKRLDSYMKLKFSI